MTGVVLLALCTGTLVGCSSGTKAAERGAAGIEQDQDTEMSILTNTPEITAPVAPVPMTAERFVGLTESDAMSLAEAWGLKTRVESRDSESYGITADYVFDRVNFTIESGTVVAARLG